MTAPSIVRRFLIGAATIVALAVAGIAMPVVVGPTPAFAQVSAEFQEALEDYGQWRPDPRYGEVWVPAGLPSGWRPYENGHWVYTDDWGWYWVSDDEEADWGWVTYHYGRWVHDRRSWFWVPGDEWAPAWVDWRYGGDYVGWAPLPPDDMDIDAYEAEPAYWVFVPDRYMTAPRLRSYFIPRERRMTILRSTRIINRTLAVHGARLAVNPGISPAFVARVTHAALPTYRVRPRVFGSTVGVSGAVQVRREDLHRRGGPPGAPRINAVSVQRTTTVINASASVSAPTPLSKGEHGHLGSHPPRAAQGASVGAPAKLAPIMTPPSGAPPQTPPHTGPAPAVAPIVTPAPVQQPKTIAPAGSQPQIAPVHPTGPPPPPPPGPKQQLNVQPAQQPHPTPPPPVVHTQPPPPPPVVHAPPPPPPPVVRAPPPPVVHAPPPPPVVHAPPPQAKPAAPAQKPADKPPEVPK